MSMGSGYYGEVGYSAIKFDDQVTSTTPKLVRLIAGTNINESFDAEVAVAFTASEGDIHYPSENRKLTAKQMGIYVKPKIEMGKDTEFFGRLGISHTTWKSYNSTLETSDSFTKPAFGFGIKTQFTKDVYGQVDYMHLGEKNSVSAQGITMSVGMRF